MSRKNELVSLIDETMTITAGMSELLELAQAAAKDGKAMSAATCAAMLELVSTVEIRLDEAASLIARHNVA